MVSLKKIANLSFKILAIIGVLFVILIVYYMIFPDEYFKIKFSITEDNSPIDGDVYLDDTYLGKTKEGVLNVNILNLSNGNLKLAGVDNGDSFELNYDFKAEWILNGNQEFIASLQDITDAKFDASKLDLRKVEKQIFELVNLEREKYPKAGIRSLRWNDKVSEVAKEHSVDMLEKEYFSHNTLENVETLESTDFSQRLTDSNIFYFVSNENLILLPIYPDTDIAKEAVDGWLSSPGHRSTLLDLDNLYSDTGVGVACGRDMCYITMDFISLRYSIENEIKDDSCWFVPLYDESSIHNNPLNIYLFLNSTSNVKVYIAKEISLKRCISRDSIDFTKSYGSVRHLDEQLIINKGDGILFSTNSDSKLNLIINYLTN